MLRGNILIEFEPYEETINVVKKKGGIFREISIDSLVKDFNKFLIQDHNLSFNDSKQSQDILNSLFISFILGMEAIIDQNSFTTNDLNKSYEDKYIKKNSVFFH